MPIKPQVSDANDLIPGKTSAHHPVTLWLYLRCATNAEDMQLRLIQAHVAKGEPGEEAGEEDEDGYEDGEDDELGVMLLSSLGKRVDMRGAVYGGVCQWVAVNDVVGKLGDMMYDERGYWVE